MINRHFPRPIRPRGPLVFSLALLGIAGTLLTAFWGCGLATGGLPSTGGADAGGPLTCNTDTDCNLPCVVGTCGSDKVCTLNALNNVQSPSQTPGDCIKVMCVAGQPVNTPDPTDVPASTNPCQKSSCVNETPTETPLANGTACSVSSVAGLCTAGICIASCKADSDCPTKGACLAPSCNLGTSLCQYQPLPDGTLTPGVPKDAGTCEVHVCQGGVDTSIADNANLPTATSDCVTALCTNGNPSLPPVAADSHCSTFDANQPGFCNDAGTCEQCTKQSECFAADPTDNCQVRNCTNGTCGPYPGSGVTAQKYAATAGACHTAACAADGGYTIIADDSSNVPTTTNTCLVVGCDGGTPVSTPANAGKACGAGNTVCDANGNCGCQSNADCAGISCTTCGGGGTPQVCGCTSATCASLGFTCGSPAPSCQTCNNQLNCNDDRMDGTETDTDCGGDPSTCPTRCANGKHCQQGSDCGSGFCVENVCCETNCRSGTTCMTCLASRGAPGGVDGQCQDVAAGNASDGDCTVSGGACGQDGKCNGRAACEVTAAGIQCADAGCDPTPGLIDNPMVCNGLGTCVVGSPATTGCNGFLCSGGECAATCNGQCVFGYQCQNRACVADLAAGQPCDAGPACASGECLGGVCCKGSCNPCQVCVAGSGNCATAPDGTIDGRCDPAAPCGNDGTCIGGACARWDAGTICNVSCQGGNSYQTTYCDGNGNCNGTTTSGGCAGYGCQNPNGCFSSCTGDWQCDDADGYHCDAGTCALPADGGSDDGGCADGGC